jgi:membrane-associated phospholipid phosphatase
MNVDLAILETLNGLVADKGFLFLVFSALGNNPLLRGGPVFASLAMISFSESTPRVKSQILLGLFATFLAVIVSLWCQRHLHVHLRPVFDGSLNIKDVEGWANYKNSWGQRLYSLPSDTATAYFAIGTIVYLQRKILGLFCFFWIFLTVGLGRVVLGFHYPSDIVAGLFLGFSLVLLFTNLKAAQAFLMRAMQRYDARNCIYATFICLFSAEAYSLFPGLREIYLSLIKLLGNHA